MNVRDLNSLAENSLTFANYVTFISFAISSRGNKNNKEDMNTPIKIMVIMVKWQWKGNMCQNMRIIKGAYI